MKIWAIWENSSGNWTLIIYLDFFLHQRWHSTKTSKDQMWRCSPCDSFWTPKKQLPSIGNPTDARFQVSQRFFFRKWWKPVEMWQSSTTLLQGIHRTSSFTAQKTATKNSMAKKNDNHQGPLSRNEHQLCNDFLERCLFALERCKIFGCHSPYACP